jgi:hypothetical protein
MPQPLPPPVLGPTRGRRSLLTHRLYSANGGSVPDTARRAAGTTSRRCWRRSSLPNARSPGGVRQAADGSSFRSA